jgi:hypothetical protein
MAMHIPLNAHVECVDGTAGRSSYVIVNPGKELVTHFVVQDKRIHSTERMVPIDWIEETTPNSIRLRCTRDELATLEPFIEHHDFLGKRPRFVDVSSSGWLVPIAQETVLVPIEYERIPRGELAVHRGADIRATDGCVGHIDEFLVDPRTKHITDLVVRRGHLWSQEDVKLPVSVLEHCQLPPAKAGWLAARLERCRN